MGHKSVPKSKSKSVSPTKITVLETSLIRLYSNLYPTYCQCNYTNCPSDFSIGGCRFVPEIGRVPNRERIGSSTTSLPTPFPTLIPSILLIITKHNIINDNSKSADLSKVIFVGIMEALFKELHF